MVLIDVKHKIVVSYKLVEEEIDEVIYDFLRVFTDNSPRIAITTDLKREFVNLYLN